MEGLETGAKKTIARAKVGETEVLPQDTAVGTKRKQMNLRRTEEEVGAGINQGLLPNQKTVPLGAIL